MWRFLRKLKIKLPHDPAIPLLDTYPDKTVIQKDGCAPRFTIAKTWKQPKCSSTDERMDKEDFLHTHTHTQNGISFSHRKE